MATSLALTAALSLSGNLDNPFPLTTPTEPIDQLYKHEFANGTGAGQCDLEHNSQRTLGASASETHDLRGTGASLSDKYGTVLNFARVKLLIIKAAAGNTNNVVVGNAAANPFVGPLGGTTPTISVRPGETKVIILCGPADATGFPVTDSSNDQLKVANSGAGTGVTYDLWIAGCSA